MAAIFQTIFSNAFSWVATSHHLNQWWLVCRRMHAPLGFNELSPWTQVYGYHHISMWAIWMWYIHFSNNSSKKMHTTLINISLRWRHNDHAGVSNHQPHGCLFNRLYRRTSKKTSKLRVTGLCAGNSPGTGEFPAQMASYAENVSIWWRHHVSRLLTIQRSQFKDIIYMIYFDVLISV